MKIIITNFFIKKIKKIKSVKLDDIENLIKKIPNTNLVVEIDEFDNNIIFKGYLNSKNIRIIILFQKIKEVYFPVSLFKKETKKGKNITKQNYIDFCKNDIEKSILEYKNGNYIEL